MYLRPVYYLPNNCGEMISLQLMKDQSFSKSCKSWQVIIINDHMPQFHSTSKQQNAAIFIS